jgi:xanthine dehydrogenase YagR molybdenum-binding subunit
VAQDFIATQGVIGQPHARVDGRVKVTGQARYGSDFGPPGAAYAALVTSRIARGRIVDIDERRARETPGVLDILTWKTVAGRIRPGKMFLQDDGYMGSTIAPLQSDRIEHDGEIVALVVADTLEAAEEGAAVLDVAYAEEPASATFDSPGAETVAAAKISAARPYEDPRVGDADRALAEAPVKVDQHYSTPTQHHNPIELFWTVCDWSHGKLSVWESSQYVKGFQYGLAKQLGLEPDEVRVISPYVGGAFGSRGALTQRTALVALAAQRVKRPVKLQTNRAQGFTIASYRAETRHHVALGAERDGRLTALIHEGWEISSRPDSYKVAGTDASTRMYACPNVRSEVFVVHADRNTPGFMRAPPETPYMFALECAMDELAYALNMDPVELRRVNDTQVEPIRHLPYTSRALMPCFDAAFQAFGWSRRDPRPGAMREGDWLIGWGCATTTFPALTAPATARVALLPNGTARVQTAAHDIGTGAYTVIAMTAADQLGLPVAAITVELGDSGLPPSPVAGGSNTTGSVCTVVAQACGEIRDRIARAATAPDAPFSGHDPDSLRLIEGDLVAPDGRRLPLDRAQQRASNGAIEAYAENLPPGVRPEGLKMLHQGLPAMTGGAWMKDRVQFAFGAQFVEVRVHGLTGEVRVPRMVGAFAAGRIIDPLTARSQLMGGMIWGVSAALHEATEIDQRVARYYNTDLAEYMIPVNADIGEAEVIFVPETDAQVNPLGVKGVGELGNVGMNAAVANAVFHATGVRVRHLPIRMEKLLKAPALVH